MYCIFVVNTGTHRAPNNGRTNTVVVVVPGLRLQGWSCRPGLGVGVQVYLAIEIARGQDRRMRANRATSGSSSTGENKNNGICYCVRRICCPVSPQHTRPTKSHTIYRHIFLVDANRDALSYVSTYGGTRA